jgi:midasin
VLDELNLAPSTVLEALNRLLDDNRELFIPETQEVVRAHPDFRLFATQNPAGGLYGGRKPLSRAFRNRFFEVHVAEPPAAEVQAIVAQRAALPPSFAAAMVEAAAELRRLRQASAVFAGREGFVTMRDLLRWGMRRPQSWAQLAADGFMLLAERLRNPAEVDAVRSVLQRHCRTDTIDPLHLYRLPIHAETANDATASAATASAATATSASPQVPSSSSYEGIEARIPLALGAPGEKHIPGTEGL